MPSKMMSRDQFKLVGDEVTHMPTGKRCSAYPGTPNISSENVVNVGDYREYEIRELAATLLAERLKKK